MKLDDIFEMTQRSGIDIDSSMPFVQFDLTKSKKEGYIQGGNEVYSFPHDDTVIYGVKDGDDIVAYTQLKQISIPTISNTYESLNSKTLPSHRGQMLTYKLRYFLCNHLGITVVLGDFHSYHTEMSLPKVAKWFNLKMINIKTGEMVDWTEENYESLTDRHNVTEWRVMIQGTSTPYNERDTSHMTWTGSDRHLWTYGENFKDSIFD